MTVGEGAPRTQVQSTERNSTMKASLDKGRFGPCALVTGASSGIGKEFTRQIAASGINVVLVAKRDALLAELGCAISQEFDVQYRALAMDLSQEEFIAGLADATRDIDIGLVVSNAGTGSSRPALRLPTSTGNRLRVGTTRLYRLSGYRSLRDYFAVLDSRGGSSVGRRASELNQRG